MANPLAVIFSHSHHLLQVADCNALLDVLAFEGQEELSKPFSYRIEFTSADHGIHRQAMLMKAASLTLQAPFNQGAAIKLQQPLRVIQGVVTGFERLGTTNDESRYALTLSPRLALLAHSRQNAIYQDMSAPQIVEKILRERHGMVAVGERTCYAMGCVASADRCRFYRLGNGAQPADAGFYGFPLAD